MSDKILKPEKRVIDLTKSDYISCKADALYGYNTAIEEYEIYLKWIKQIVLEDVPHKYQKRLLEELK